MNKWHWLLYFKCQTERDINQMFKPQTWFNTQPDYVLGVQDIRRYKNSWTINQKWIHNTHPTPAMSADPEVLSVSIETNRSRAWLAVVQTELLLFLQELGTWSAPIRRDVFWQYPIHPLFSICLHKTPDRWRWYDWSFLYRQKTNKPNSREFTWLTRL